MCVLPAREGGAKPLDERDRSFEEWSTVLQKWFSEGQKLGSGVVTRRLRLFFLCPLDMSLAECGPDGQGYEVSSATDGRVDCWGLLFWNIFIISRELAPCRRTTRA